MLLFKQFRVFVICNNGVGKVLFRISGSRIASELVELKSQRPRAKRATRDGESSRNSGIPATGAQSSSRRHVGRRRLRRRMREAGGEKHDCTPRKGRKRRKGESGEIRREKETTWPGSEQLRVKRRRYARRSDETEGKWRKKTMKGDVRRERPFSPFLSSPQLASCICHWVARACRLALVHDTRGGHVGGWRRAVDDGGDGSRGEAGKVRQGGWLTERVSKPTK